VLVRAGELIHGNRGADGEEYVMLFITTISMLTDPKGLFGGSSTIVILFKWANFTLCLAALATAGLGIYGSGLSIAAAFDSSAGTSFGCAAPV
jgi:hypothetical protein